MCQNVTTHLTLDTDQLTVREQTKSAAQSHFSQIQTIQTLHSDKLQRWNPKNIPEIFEAIRIKYPRSTAFSVYFPTRIFRTYL